MNIRRIFDEAHFPLWGFVGSAVGYLFILGAAIPYRGREGEPYSFARHFVSELGEIGVSDAAILFNTGLILAGFLFIPFMIGLGMYLDNIFGRIAGVVGVYSSVSIIFVGIFPMNYSEQHYLSAMSFFFSGLLMVLLWTLALLLQKESRIPKILAFGGLVNAFCFAAFLFGDYGSFSELSERPAFWLLPFFEWSIYFAIISYLLLISIYVWKKGRLQSAPLVEDI
jgi:hypothetical membrane protein